MTKAQALKCRCPNGEGVCEVRNAIVCHSLPLSRPQTATEAHARQQDADSQDALPLAGAENALCRRSGRTPHNVVVNWFSAEGDTGQPMRQQI